MPESPTLLHTHFEQQLKVIVELAKGPLVHHHHISSRMLAGGQTDLDSQYAWALINLTSLLLVRLHTSVTEQEFSPTPHLVMKV